LVNKRRIRWRRKKGDNNAEKSKRREKGEE
jgi:hypothetical protein